MQNNGNKIVNYPKYDFDGSDMSKYHEVGCLQNGNKFSHSYEGLKFKMKVSAELVSSEIPLLALQMGAFALCPHMAAPWSVLSIS